MQETLFSGLLLWRYVNLTLYGRVVLPKISSITPKNGCNGVLGFSVPVLRIMNIYNEVGSILGSRTTGRSRTLPRSDSLGLQP